MKVYQMSYHLDETCRPELSSGLRWHGVAVGDAIVTKTSQSQQTVVNSGKFATEDQR
jgi:hypothetical protein